MNQKICLYNKESDRARGWWNSRSNLVAWRSSHTCPISLGASGLNLVCESQDGEKQCLHLHLPGGWVVKALQISAGSRLCSCVINKGAASDIIASPANAIQKYLLGWEMAQQGKRLLCAHGDQCLDLGVAEPTCNPSTGEAETVVFLGAQWPTQMWTPGSVIDCFNKQVRGSWRGDSVVESTCCSVQFLALILGSSQLSVAPTLEVQKCFVGTWTQVHIQRYTQTHIILKIKAKEN